MSIQKIVSDGSTASYYELPSWAKELQDLIRFKNLNGAQAEMFRALYRGAEASHSDEQRQAKKILAYAVDEMVRTHFPDQSFAAFRNLVFQVFGDRSPITEAERFFKWGLAILPPFAATKDFYQIGIDSIDREDIQQLRHGCFTHVLYTFNHELSYNQLCKAFFAALQAQPLEEATNWPDGVEQ